MSALRETCSGLPDKRRGKNVQYLMADIGMAAFSVFFMQSPSFLAHQRHLADGYGHGRSNCETLFGMERIPSDNHVRGTRWRRNASTRCSPERSKRWKLVAGSQPSAGWAITC